MPRLVMVTEQFTRLLLAIAGLKKRDILGYTTVALLASGVVFAATLLLVSL